MYKVTHFLLLSECIIGILWWTSLIYDRARVRILVLHYIIATINFRLDKKTQQTLEFIRLFCMNSEIVTCFDLCPAGNVYGILARSNWMPSVDHYKLEISLATIWEKEVRTHWNKKRWQFNNASNNL